MSGLNYGVLTTGQISPNPILMGYGNYYLQHVEDFGLSAGTNSINGDVVPANEIWVVTNLLCYMESATIVAMVFNLRFSGWNYELWAVMPPTNGIRYDRQGWWVMPPASNIRMTIGNCTLGDNAWMDIAGFKFSIR